MLRIYGESLDKLCVRLNVYFVFIIHLLLVKSKIKTVNIRLRET